MTTETETLEVTSVQVYPVKASSGKTKALARVVLMDQLQLTNLRVIEGSNGVFVGYPNDPSHKGEDYRQLFYPVTAALRNEIERVVLEKYEAVISE